jgi:colanic acid/amylovoran biosynthesis glycosyltransferase
MTPHNSDSGRSARAPKERPAKLDRCLRVLYVVSKFPTYSETFIVREISELIRLGVDVRIISLKHSAEPIVQSDAAALLDRVLYPRAWWINLFQTIAALLTHPRSTSRSVVHLVRGFAKRPRALGKSLVVFWRTMGLTPIVREWQPTHVHAHYATYPSTAALILHERLGIPFSFTSHAHDIYAAPHLLEDKLARSAFSVTISNYNRKHLAEVTNGIGHDRIQVIHCGVRQADFEFRPEERETCCMLAVGRLDGIKGFRFLIEACGILAASGRRFTCHILGDGPLRQAISDQIAQLGLGDCVRLHGIVTQEEVRRYLYKASIFVLPSVRTVGGDVMDGIPVSLMEAMAVGVPVVSTRLSGIPELIEHGVSGLLASPGDAQGLAACIEQFLDGSIMSRTLVANARRRIEQDFDVRKETAKLHECMLASQAWGASRDELSQARHSSRTPEALESV